MPDLDEIRAIFDAEARHVSPDEAEGRPFALDGPVMRIDFSTVTFVHTSPDLGVDGPELEALIARQVEATVERGVPVEWKHFAGDRPDSLVPLLLASGFEPSEAETVMLAASDELPAAPSLDDTVVRDARADEFDAIAELFEEIWHSDHRAFVEELRMLRELRGDAGIRILVAEADQRIVSAGWITMRPGSRLAGLWGGSTHPAYRRRGIYRALVAARAQIALDAGVPFLRVDASAMSRPVLGALGFVEVTTTTPYLWEP